MVRNKMYFLRPTAPRKPPINILPSSSPIRQTIRRGTVYAGARPSARPSVMQRRGTVYAGTRPSVMQPTVQMTMRPTAFGGATRLTRPTGGIAGIVPTTLTARPPRAGITSAGASTGGLGLGLAGIGSDIQATGSGIVDTAKSLIPTAVKVVAAVLVFKIVLWLIRGRR